MNQKQLANVLIKILGLSFCVESIVRIISGMISLLASLASRTPFGSGIYLWANPLTGVALAVIGFLFIVLSHPIAELLFKDE
jgi:hypothetical protein